MCLHACVSAHMSDMCVLFLETEFHISKSSEISLAASPAGFHLMISFDGIIFTFFLGR